MKSNKKVNTYFICATQPDNLGDLIINKMLIDELSIYGYVYLDAWGIPDEFKLPLLENENVIDVSNFNFTVKRMSLRYLLRYIFFLKRKNVKLITRSPGPLVEQSEKVRLGFALINNIGKLCKARVVYLGNCCSSALSSGYKLKSTHMDEIYARSQHSIDYAKKFFKCPISFIPDMAFLMKSSKLREKKNIVIVDYRAIADNNDLLISDLKSIIKEFLSLGYSVELYYQVKSDMEDMLTLYDVLRIDGVTMRKDILWYDDIENYYSDKSFVISNRLHSLIFGAVYGVLPIARITEDSHLAKIMHVFRNSLPEVFYNNMEIMSQLDVRELVENEDLYRGNLNSYMINNKKKCSDIIEKIVSYLT